MSPATRDIRFKVRRCRSCRAEIIWAHLVPGGGRHPVDADPVENGNIILEAPAIATDPPRATMIGRMQAQQLEVPLYCSHFASCPHAAEWRRRRA